MHLSIPLVALDVFLFESYLGVGADIFMPLGMYVTIVDARLSWNRLFPPIFFILISFHWFILRDLLTCLFILIAYSSRPNDPFSLRSVEWRVSWERWKRSSQRGYLFYDFVLWWRRFISILFLIFGLASKLSCGPVALSLSSWFDAGAGCMVLCSAFGLPLC